MSEKCEELSSLILEIQGLDALKRAVAIECAARSAHEVNRAYCESIMDMSQAPWSDAPEWQRASARAGVEAILDNPDTTPEQSHEGWARIKLTDGWTYGPVKDPDLKTHPCLVSYADLPASQKIKDTLFGAAVRGCFAHIAMLGRTQQ